MIDAVLESAAADPAADPGADPGIDAFVRAYQGNRIAEARALIERHAAANPRDPQALYHLALVLYLHYLERERPMALLTRILRFRPDHAEALQLLSNIHLGSGDKILAADYARRCIAVAPKSGVAWLNLAMAAPRDGPDLLDPIHAILSEGGLSAYHRRALHGALGKIYDRQDETVRAFHHFTAANHCAGGAYAAKAMVKRLVETKEVFDAGFFRAKSGLGSDDPRMVFILGAPRSGSTLLERMLARHPDIDTAGERSDLPALNVELHGRATARGVDAGFVFRHLRGLDAATARATAEAYMRRITPALRQAEARWVIDKLPGNYAYIGLIRVLFPNAAILHARRHVLDVALSCYTQSFSHGLEYTNDLGAFAHFWITYAETMIHWRAVLGEAVTTMSYERMVAAPEAQIRRALGRIGADWSADCLDPGGHDRVVTTASVTQVRAPIHAGAVGRWRRYETQLAPVIRALGGMKAVEKIAAAEIA